jgi:hypothetical protein
MIPTKSKKSSSKISDKKCVTEMVIILGFNGTQAIISNVYESIFSPVQVLRVNYGGNLLIESSPGRHRRRTNRAVKFGGEETRRSIDVRLLGQPMFSF